MISEETISKFINGLDTKYIYWMLNTHMRYYTGKQVLI